MKHQNEIWVYGPFTERVTVVNHLLSDKEIRDLLDWFRQHVWGTSEAPE